MRVRMALIGVTLVAAAALTARADDLAAKLVSALGKGDARAAARLLAAEDAADMLSADTSDLRKVCAAAAAKAGALAVSDAGKATEGAGVLVDVSTALTTSDAEDLYAHWSRAEALVARGRVRRHAEGLKTAEDWMSALDALDT